MTTMVPERPPLTLTDAELIAGSPATEWEGRCYEISTALADAYRGTAVYGHWTGPVADRSHFLYARSTGFARHGWIELPDKSIVDPTRFAFEMVAPYIYTGDNDHYDRGGNVLRASMIGEPPDDPDDGSPPLPLAVPEETAALIFAMTGWRDLSDLASIQVWWLAHVSPEVYGEEHAAAIFSAIAAAGARAHVPIDNWIWVMGDDDED